MFMVLHSDVQKKCQDEIHENIGTKPPSMDDIPNLPYIAATIMEIQRMSLTAPGTLQHKLRTDQGSID